MAALCKYIIGIWWFREPFDGSASWDVNDTITQGRIENIYNTVRGWIFVEINSNQENKSTKKDDAIVYMYYIHLSYKHF